MTCPCFFLLEVSVPFLSLSNQRSLKSQVPGLPNEMLEILASFVRGKVPALTCPVSELPFCVQSGDIGPLPRPIRCRRALCCGRGGPFTADEWTSLPALLWSLVALTILSDHKGQRGTVWNFQMLQTKPHECVGMNVFECLYECVSVVMLPSQYHYTMSPLCVPVI